MAAYDRRPGPRLCQLAAKHHNVVKCEVGSRIFHIYRLIYSTLDIYKKGLLFQYGEHEETERQRLKKKCVQLHHGQQG